MTIAATMSPNFEMIGNIADLLSLE